MSASTAIFWPLIAQAALTYSVYYLLFHRRVHAVKAGQAKVSQFRANLSEPELSQTAKSNIANQFELPVLFYAACISIYVTGLASIYPVLLAWAFFLTRLVHAFVHLTHNKLRNRMKLFISGYMVLGLLWIWLAIGLATK